MNTRQSVSSDIQIPKSTISKTRQVSHPISRLFECSDTNNCFIIIIIIIYNNNNNNNNNNINNNNYYYYYVAV